ncbi:hypothetical protein RFI_15141 [Reticulomyxa filosa]|uniref:Uncharacterized protein n=1 Tax=Reticulomyxa filosa TaxID=46433 RepID=X6N813_RETFI|nr:hypothetical protein RFI_15141 [Reticulomyxa filosa]|eukprot:ETO22063.1 hypothetical protein RFI_15141 [Reticulomyxa filosa]
MLNNELKGRKKKTSKEINKTEEEEEDNDKKWKNKVEIYFKLEPTNTDKITNAQVITMTASNVVVNCWRNQEKFMMDVKYHIVYRNVTKNNEPKKRRECKAPTMINVSASCRYHLHIECEHPKYGIIAKSETIDFITPSKNDNCRKLAPESVSEAYLTINCVNRNCVLEWKCSRKFVGSAYYALVLEYPSEGGVHSRKEAIVLGTTTHCYLHMDWKSLYEFCRRYELDLHEMNDPNYHVRLKVQTICIDKWGWTCEDQLTNVVVRLQKKQSHKSAKSPTMLSSVYSNPLLYHPSFVYVLPQHCLHKCKYIYHPCKSSSSSSSSLSNTDTTAVNCGISDHECKNMDEKKSECLQSSSSFSSYSDLVVKNLGWVWTGSTSTPYYCNRDCNVIDDTLYDEHLGIVVVIIVKPIRTQDYALCLTPFGSTRMMQLRYCFDSRKEYDFLYVLRGTSTLRIRWITTSTSTRSPNWDKSVVCPKSLATNTMTCFASKKTFKIKK